MTSTSETAKARYAVIFSSERTASSDGYEETDQKLLEMVRQQPGFLRVESLGTGRRGITISYWTCLEAIRAWRQVEVHREAQERGRSEWYQRYRIEVCRIEREYSFEASLP